MFELFQNLNVFKIWIIFSSNIFEIWTFLKIWTFFKYENFSYIFYNKYMSMYQKMLMSKNSFMFFIEFFMCIAK
jgi:hypothetical protein